MVEYEWNETKREQNLEKHGVDFASMELFDWDAAVIERSDRQGEERFGGVSFIWDRLHYVAFTERGNAIRIISLRIANAAERRWYAQANV